MKILQRRSKLISPDAVDSLSANVSASQQQLWSRWQALPPRDQLALAILMLFLLVLVGGYGGYSIHQAAKDSEADYQEQVADYFWLRAQAGNIDSNALSAAAQQGTAQPPATRVNSILSSAGVINAQVIATGNAVQFSFTHDSQAIASAALGKLEAQGWQFTQLSMQQDTLTKAMQVQATVSM